MSIYEYLHSLLQSPGIGRQVVHHEHFDMMPAQYAENVRQWPQAVTKLLQSAGIQNLYSHQVEATDNIRAGRNVIVATPTASGKTFIYNLPVAEKHLFDRDGRSLYIFPLKALAQDQYKAFSDLFAPWPEAARPTSAIYDGDTTAWFRKKIRDNPPNVLITNPEMLHLSLLPHYEKWALLWAQLQYIVLDEVHTYRGVLGSHMAQVLRRLLRVCKRMGAEPTFVFCSATIGNPKQLVKMLTGLDGVVVDAGGAPQGKRHFVFLNPETSPSKTVIQLLNAALHRELKTIVYTQSRKMTELLSMWAGGKDGMFRKKISAYRAGFLPEERRDIEKRMSSGELNVVISTSALELGIDIGLLDLCILVGYPGSITSVFQRGGRVGRSLRESAVIMVAGEDALDQYFMRNPKDFFQRPPESAVLNPYNPVILEKHLECAASEFPLAINEEWLQSSQIQEVLSSMEAKGIVFRSKEGNEIYARRKRPHRDVHLRGSGGEYSIETKEAEDKWKQVGSIDEYRAYKEAHEGAVYLHRGRSFVVDEMNIHEKSIKVSPRNVDYYTRARGNKVTEIIEVTDTKQVLGTTVGLGKLKITESTTGYEKRRVRDGMLMNVVPLDLPDLTFETEGLWILIPDAIRKQAEAQFLHFMGGIHAMEHALIGMLPLLVMTDRNDLGGISTPMHPQTAASSVFIYDGMPGGAGLSSEAYNKAEELICKTYEAIRACECELGCPSCVHSPKCGSGNRPIDKAATLFLQEKIIRSHDPVFHSEMHITNHEKNVGDVEIGGERTVEMENSEKRKDTKTLGFGILDIETRLSAAEVGGWHKAYKMGVSVAVLYDSLSDDFHVFQQDQIPDLVERLIGLEMVVGFNIKRFDYKVLMPFTNYDLWSLPTVDLLEVIKNRLNYRLSLDHVAGATLGVHKQADGLQALKWWKEGRMDEIIRYCKSDVKITRDLYLFGKDHGYILFTNKAKKIVRLPVQW